MPLSDDAGRPLKVFKGLMDTLGGRMTAWGRDHATIEIDVTEKLRNGIDLVHGGVMAALIDTAGAHAGIFCAEPGRVRQAMTVSLNVNLVGNIGDGVLIAKARVGRPEKRSSFHPVTSRTVTEICWPPAKSSDVTVLAAIFPRGSKPRPRRTGHKFVFWRFVGGSVNHCKRRNQQHI